MQPMTYVRTAVISIAMLTLSACGTPPTASSHLNRGPESLIDVSAEIVNLSVANPSEVKELAGWIDRDRPTRAELSCVAGTKQCVDAQKVLELNGVPYAAGTNAENSVTLFYERILARDCDQRYVDNAHNSYNVTHPHFGCAVSANIVQHATDKQQFVSPNLSEAPSAVRGVNDIKRAYAPREIVQPYSLDDALTNKAKSGS
jgi:type IV pilus biogenesis protein CpaD/CtpE